MAQRRMFNKSVIDSDIFLDMPLSTQALYFHLAMRADDDGFVDNTKRISRMIGAGEDDVKLLIAKGFAICFESGVIVISHWLQHNSIRKDRKSETTHENEILRIIVDNQGVYQLSDEMTTICQPNDNQMTTKCPHRLGKVRLGKVRLGQYRPEPPPPPSNDVALEFYRSNIGEPNKYVENKIAKYRESGCADDLIILAFEKMAQVGTNNTGYADMVINDAIARGTLDAASFKASKQGRQYTGRNTTVDRATPSGNNVLANAANRPRKLKREG